MRPYIKDGLRWEDPIDGDGPKAHGRKRRPSQRRKMRTHKKAVRQQGRKAALVGDNDQ